MTSLLDQVLLGFVLTVQDVLLALRRFTARKVEEAQRRCDEAEARNTTEREAS